MAKRLGFELRRQKGSHAIYLRAADKRRVVIPVHAGKMIKPKSLAGHRTGHGDDHRGVPRLAVGAPRVWHDQT
ncbi:MAG TPA: type II toxin-antitoxin system HicA family toxin [bacterium]